MMRRQEQAREAWLLSAVFVAGVIAIVSRRPDAVTYPQFYIEDGDHWYWRAHEIGGLAALHVTHRGYFVLVQALSGALASMVPLASAPLVMALFGIAIDVLPAVFVASSRFARVVPSLTIRLFLAFLCVAAPNAWTVMSNSTNTMWYLSLLAGLVVVSSPPPTHTWRVFDTAVVTLSGLSGPFAVMLIPVAAVKWWLRRERTTLLLLAIAVITGALQLASMLLSPRPTPMPLGASAATLGELFAKRVVYEALFGQAGGYAIMMHAWPAFWSSPATLVCAALLGIGLVVYALVRAPLELRLLILYAAAILAATLIWPGDALGDDRWWRLLMPASNGNRYFLMPALVFLVICVWAAATGPRAIRAGSILLVAVAVAVGIRLNWREPPYPDFDFPASVRRYQAAPIGAKVAVMTLPERLMTLTKRPGEPVIDVPDPCGGEIPVTPSFLVSNQVTWNGRVATSDGTDPYAIYGLPTRQWVCGVRLRVVLLNGQRTLMRLQMFWADSVRNDITGERRNSSLFVTPGPEMQTVVFHVSDTIDRIRLDPGIEAGTLFELRGVDLLTRKN